MAFLQHKDRDDFRIVDGLLAVHIDAREPRAREELLERSRERVGEAGGNGGLASVDRLMGVFGDDPAMIARVTSFVDIFEVADPQRAAAAFDDDADVSASPIHALAFSWHAAMTATVPEPVKTSFAEVPAGSRERVIAVVDTGIVEPDCLPPWMSSSIIGGQNDIETLVDDDASHGTFVASLLRQIAPENAVSMARAMSFGEKESRDRHPVPDPTTEFHVADAIHRLVERHRGESRTIEALNLSVGGPSLGDREMATLRSALARWREAFPTTPIFAAAGNLDDPARIYPAALRYVRGVAAANHDGDQIVWDHGNEKVWSAAPRDWVDDIAPGSELIGLGGRSSNDTIRWSGSSFATAVATASYVNGGPVDVSGGIAHWPDRSMRYGDVPGLKFA